MRLAQVEQSIIALLLPPCLRVSVVGSLFLGLILLHDITAYGQDRGARPAPPATFFEPLGLRQEPAAAAKAQEAKEAAAARAKEAAAARAKQQEEALNAQAQQYIQMLQPTLWTELDFVRQVCELKPEQRPKIKAAGEESLKKAAREIAQPRVAGGGRRQTSQMDAATTIRTGLAQALKETLPGEQFDKYSHEAAQRMAHRKQAAILGVVARLDALLCLTAEQRDKLVETFNANWQGDWEHWLMLHHYGGQYLPQIPEQHVVPHLNEEQKSVWRGVQKIGVGGIWGGEGRERTPDDWWEGRGK